MMRVYNREKKRQWREKQNQLKKMEVKAYDRDRHFLRQKFEEAKVHFYQGKKTIQITVSRKRKLDVRPSSRPLKKPCIRGKGKKIVKDIILKMKANKGKIIEKAEIYKSIVSKYRNLHQASKDLGVRWSTLQRNSYHFQAKNFSHALAIPQAVKDSVVDFYIKPLVSIQLPDAKCSVNKRYLTRNLKSAYNEYKKEHPKKNVGFSTFAKLRPKNGKLLCNMPMRQCVCEKCEYFDLCIKALAASGVRVQSQDRFSAINGSLCTFDNQPQMDCVKRDCKESGVEIVRDKLKDECKEKKISWYQWMRVKKDGKTKIALVNIKGTVGQLIELYLEQMHPMALHLFVGSWQYRQFQESLKNIGDKNIVQVLDFGQNKLLMYQDEPQAVHWVHTQITVHPIVNYYMCQNCETDIVQEDVVIISDDLKHDSAAVFQFELKTNEHLKDRGLKIGHCDQFTDRAASQYKSCKSFWYLSDSNASHGYSVNRHYFGSGHGKGPSDGATATFKRLLNTAVKSRDAQFSTSLEVCNYSTQNWEINSKEGECTHYRRHFIHVFEEDIKEVRMSIQDVNTKTVPGTRSLHSVRSKMTSGEVQVRNLSCFCLPCLGKERSRCTNGAHVTKWETVQVVVDLPGSKKKKTDQNMEKRQKIERG